MSHPEAVLFERLGGDGLARVLHDVLDQTRLVRLANTCGLRYPGMRTRSQRPERLLADLVDRASREEPTRKAVSRMLRKEAAAALRAWSRLTADEKLKRLDDPDLPANGQLGLHLYLAAQDGPDEALQAALARLLGSRDLRPDVSEHAQDRERARLARETTRLKKKVSDLQKKLRHQEMQLARLRETEKTVKRDLVTRKGELAESRMLVERLRGELAEARGAAANAATHAASDPGGEALDKLAAGLRKLGTQQRKLVHAVGKLVAKPDATARPAADPLEALHESMAALNKELAALRRDRRKEVKDRGAQLDELRGEVRSLRSTISKRTISAPVVRRKGKPERVGVFVDVQNMYYGARQLKGKLDFDALLQAAVRDRRMVQAKAYVVESKEIDQSGFISILQQRAIEVARKTVRVRADGSMKGDWDMEMALDILDTAPDLDVVVLVSGDGDFTSLVKRIKRMGPKVEVIGWPRNTAKSLIEAADDFQPLDRKFMIRTPSRRKPARSAASAGEAAGSGDEDGATAKS